MTRSSFINPSLFGVLIVLAVAGCSPEYSGERLYWYAELAARPVSKDPVKASPEQAADAIKGFEGVIQRAGGTVSAARAQFAVGSLHMMRQEYPQAREAFRLVTRNYGHYRQFAYAARIMLVKIYEAEHDRPGVIAAYKEIISEHPWTAIGIQAPLLLAETAKRQGDNQEAEAALQEAVTHYESLAAKAPSKEAGLRIRGQLAAALRLERLSLPQADEPANRLP